MALVAATVNWYPVLLVSPVTFAVVTLPTVSGVPTTAPVAALNVRTVYPVIGEPPSAGAVQFTVAVVSPAVAVGAAGATGAVAAAFGVTVALAVDAALSWVPLVAITLNV